MLHKMFELLFDHMNIMFQEEIANASNITSSDEAKPVTEAVEVKKIKKANTATEATEEQQSRMDEDVKPEDARDDQVEVGNTSRGR